MSRNSCAACKRHDPSVAPYQLTVTLHSLHRFIPFDRASFLEAVFVHLCWDCAQNAVGSLNVTRLSENTPDSSP